MRDMPAKKFDRALAAMGFTPSDRDAVFVDAQGRETSAVLDRYADGTWHINRRETLKRLHDAKRLAEMAKKETPAAGTAGVSSVNQL